MSRKYRQRGYQDDDRREEGREKAPPPGPRRDRLRPDRPGGRGLGSPGRKAFPCAACGEEQDPPTVRDAVCGRCGAALWSCTHCGHFDPSARFQCAEPIDAPIRSKAKANDCERYAPRLTARHDREEKPSDGKSAFDALFDGL